MTIFGKKAGAALAAIVLASLVTPGGAQAASVSTYTVACNHTMTWSFWPPLGTSINSGSVSQYYSNGMCASAYTSAGTSTVWPLPVSEGSWVSENPYSFGGSTAYLGDCSVAFVDAYFWGGTTGVLFGSSIYLSEPKTYGSAEFGEVYAFTPILPCSSSSSLGAGPAYGVGADAWL